MQAPVSPATAANHEAEGDFPTRLDQSVPKSDGSQPVPVVDMGCILSLCSVRWRWLRATTDTCGRTVGEQVQ